MRVFLQFFFSSISAIVFEDLGVRFDIGDWRWKEGNGTGFLRFSSSGAIFNGEKTETGIFS